MEDFDKLIDDIGKLYNTIADPPEVVLPIFFDWYDRTWRKAGGFEGIMNKLVSDIENVTGKSLLEASEEENLKALIEVNNKYNEKGMI